MRVCSEIDENQIRAINLRENGSYFSARVER